MVYQLSRRQQFWKTLKMRTWMHVWEFHISMIRKRTKLKLTGICIIGSIVIRQFLEIQNQAKHSYKFGQNHNEQTWPPTFFFFFNILILDNCTRRDQTWPTFFFFRSSGKSLDQHSPEPKMLAKIIEESSKNNMRILALSRGTNFMNLQNGRTKGEKSSRYPTQIAMDWRARNNSTNDFLFLIKMVTELQLSDYKSTYIQWWSTWSNPKPCRHVH